MTTDSVSEPQAAAATYIANLTSSLADVARQQGLTELAYLLDMARLEAESVVARARSGEGQAPPPDEAM